MLKTLALATLATASTLVASIPAQAASCGGASFYGTYGDGFAWRTMANGQPMNPDALTTAHRSLPFGSRIRVTNPANGRSVVVRVTDDGPHIPGRILDLTPRAFGAIASLGQGVVRVCYTRLS